MGKLILASSSPNRRQILERAGIAFDWMVSDADENAEGLQPKELVLELSRRKLEAVIPRCTPDDVIVTADTVVSIDNEILGKPHDRAEAERFLSGASQETHSGQERPPEQRERRGGCAGTGEKRYKAFASGPSEQ